MKFPQWKLRTLLIVVVILAIGLGIFARERSRLLSRALVIRDVSQINGEFVIKPTPSNWRSKLMQLTGVPDGAFLQTVKWVFEPTSRSAHLVTDQKMKDIMRHIALFSELRMIEFHECPGISDATLASFPDSHKVERIDVRGTSITKHGIDRFMKRFPNIRITDDIE